MFYQVLDKPRQDILPVLRNWKSRFYLGGGTALALLLGHRQSFDFDFFSGQEFNPADLVKELEREFGASRSLVEVQLEKNTLTVIVGGNIKLSFFHYPYPLLAVGEEDENLRLASVQDIGCMKLSAIASRATNKDYVDLYYILQNLSLEKLLDYSAEKLPALDRNLILKSLVYFKDIENEPLSFLPGKEVSMEKVEEFLVEKVKRASQGN